MRLNVFAIFVAEVKIINSVCPESQGLEQECSNLSLSAVSTGRAFEVLKAKDLTHVNEVLSMSVTKLVDIIDGLCLGKKHSGFIR